MVDETQDRPKPLSYGFEDDFADLSAFKPKPAKPKSAKTEKSKPTPVTLKTKTAGRAGQPAVLKQRDEAADKIAKTLGFKSRESQTPVLLKKRRRTHHDEPVDQLSIRGPVRVLNDFITYCEGEGVSYWEGLEQLLADNPSSTSSKK